MAKRPATHLRITTSWGNHKRISLWCAERTAVTASRNFDTTEDPTKVNCRKCIKAGGRGPGWKSS